MKLFKISFISFISIFIFQSQLYGINLRCDFQQRLFGINEKEYNGVTCGWMGSKSYCEKHGCNICKVEDDGELHQWISEVIIKNKDVEIVRELSDYEIEHKLGGSLKERKFLVESEVHQKFEFDGRRIDEDDRYLFVIQESESTSHPMNHRRFYTLFFDNKLGESILTYYLTYESLFTTSYYGECKIE